MAHSPNTTPQMTRRAFLSASLGVAALSLAGCGGSGATSGSASGSASTASTSAAATDGPITEATGDYASGFHDATIEVESYGTIKLQLDGTVAPVTVANFANLASSGFYDGLTFHRIIKGFMMQGGDPNGDGTGGSDRTIVGEFAENGHPNPISHVRGTISMARSSAPNSASSQFFIMQEDSVNLDGNYAAFGHVTDGMDVVDAICNSAEPTDSNGTIAKDKQPKITSLRMDD
ncbi:peptidylprolyl isomerase [uncultured Parolsenella sp.]|uniref:peptidylprolyl isomerase n=1 Tax=uncultured Parolsenella sp. TaxID=2083008 RepID=UPI0027DAE36E|nr:peptidylprolyl isomerase [uncultured Parolsenella sp.]